MKRTTIRGIVVAANTLEEAQEMYRAVATGQDVKALHDEEETFIVLSSASADIDMLNPLTGADDLTVGDGLTSQMEFLSSDSEAVNINYTVCTAGCQAHILADDKDLLQHCPSCASALPDLTPEQITALSAEGEEDECEGCQVSAIATGATAEEAVAAYQSMVFGETDDAKIMKCGNVLVHASGGAAFDVYKGCASTIVEAEESDFLESLSSSSDELDAHHFVCASSTCGVHVVSSDDMPTFCPSCSSGLMEVEDDEEATAGVDDEDDDEESLSSADDEDDDEESLSSSDDEEEEFESLSSDDDDEDDEEEEDEDDFDDEDDESEDDDEEEDDESEEDEDDEEEDEEDEDDDEALTLSVSSVSETPKARRARNRQEAVAAVTEEEESHNMVSVSASFVATASAALDVAKLDIMYASLSSGNTWFALYDGVPFAKAEAASTKHEQIFNSEVFGRAFKAQASEQGIPAALENMGFNEIKPVIQVADYVESEITKQVEVKTAEVAKAAAQESAELHDRFGAGLALAATGITKNFFKGKVNPIAQDLITSLSAVGLGNAAALVNGAFARHGEGYNKMLLSQARTILDYSLDTQNELATALETINGNEEANASASPVSMGRPVQVQVHQERVQATASAAKPDDDYDRNLTLALSSLGQRR